MFPSTSILHSQRTTQNPRSLFHKQPHHHRLKTLSPIHHPSGNTLHITTTPLYHQNKITYFQYKPKQIQTNSKNPKPDRNTARNSPNYSPLCFRSNTIQQLQMAKSLRSKGEKGLRAIRREFVQPVMTRKKPLTSCPRNRSCCTQASSSCLIK